MDKPQLNETLYGLFYDVFKRAGVVLGPDHLEPLRKATDKIVEAIQEEIRDAMKRLATVTVSEMKALEERLDGPPSTKKTL